MFSKAAAYIQRRRTERALRGTKVVSHTRAAVVDRGPTVRGYLTIQTRPVDAAGQPTGPWENAREDPNLVVTQAEALMAAMSIAEVNSAFNYIELGDPSPAAPPALTNINLEQTTGQRKAVTSTRTSNVVTLETTFLAGEANGFTFTEAGLFTGPFASGQMFARKTFAGITKTAAFELRFTWLITFLVQTSGGDCTGVSLIGPSTVTNLTVYNAAGGEASVAATFDFAVGANHIDVFLNGVRLVPGIHYNEAPAPLTAPIGGPPGNKGVNFIAFTLVIVPMVDQVLLVHRVLA
jgi:hypothetical protein